MSAAAAPPLISVEAVSKRFAVSRSLIDVVRGRPPVAVQAVDAVSFTVARGETLGIVGESGCGKSTLARLLLHLVAPDGGELLFDGDAVGDPNGLTLNALRRQVQIVFQDSYASLNPRMPVRDSVAFGPF
ncbi:MAG: ATP-binding cassette domain-containing protein, partial [Methylobacteriaceae bacterium]|nr:ATP-binding cassette domain-containing protein [Methylobacteriaceae bacterium]